MRRLIGCVIAVTSLSMLVVDRAAIADRGDIWTIAGAADPIGLEAHGALGDGGPAVSAILRQPVDVAVQPDGGVLVADLATRRVRRIGPDGTMSTVAGAVGGGSVLGDGGPATSARLVAPSRVAVDPRGGFAIADAPDARIRFVSSGGVITTIAGNGATGQRLVDGVAATSVPVNPTDLDFAPDGTLYVLEGSLLSRVRTDGTIWAVASDPNFGRGLAVAPNGDGVYVGGGNSLLFVDSAGAVTLVAGQPGDPGSSPDGVAAAAARFSTVNDIDVAPDGTPYVADADGRIRRIRAGVLETVAGGGSAGTPATGCVTATAAAQVVAGAIDVSASTLYLTVEGHVRAVALTDQYCPSITARSPTRVLETRTAEGQIGYAGPRPGVGSVVRLSLADSSVVPVGSRAVSLNVTAAEASIDGFVTVWSCDDQVPSTSTLNVSRGATAANAALVTIGPSRELCLLDQAGAHLVVDVTGSVDGAVPYESNAPYRAYDTRRPSLDRFDIMKPVAGETVRVDLGRIGTLSRATTPGTTVVLNVTATEATADGYVTVFPCGEQRPTASNLNLTRGGTVGRLVVTAVGTATTVLGPTGSICVFTQSGAHLIVDVLGLFPIDAPIRSVSPARLLDTRAASGPIGYTGARPASGQVVEIDVRGRTAGVGAVGAIGVRAVALNVTATDPVAAGFVTVWPCDAPRPLASTLNLSGPGDTQSNAVVVGLGDSGRVCLFTQSGAELIADLNGVLP